MYKNTIWTLEGKVEPNNKEAYILLMDEMETEVSNEVSTLAYEWTMGEDGETIHVYERYANEEISSKHLDTWSKFAPRYLELVQVNNFMVFGDLPPNLQDAIEDLNPVYVKDKTGIRNFLSSLYFNFKLF